MKKQLSEIDLDHEQIFEGALGAGYMFIGNLNVQHAATAITISLQFQLGLPDYFVLDWSNQSERIDPLNTINSWNNLVPHMRPHEMNMKPISH